MAGSFNISDKRWNSGMFRPSHSKLIAILISTVLFTCISVVVSFKRSDIYGPPLRWENLFVLFPVASLLTIFCFTKAVLRTWKFRGSCFTMDTMPGVIGGEFTGVLVLPALFDTHSKVRVEIVNEKKATRRSSDGKRVSIERFYYDSEDIIVSRYRQDGRFVRLPVKFTIPFNTKDELDNGRESSKRGDVKVSYRWLLRAKADIGGADLDLEFEVPVYRTAQSDPTIIEAVKDATELEQELTEDGGPERIQVFQELGHKRYVTKAWPSFTKIALLLFFGGIFIGFGVFLMWKGIKGFHEDADGITESIFKGIITYVPMFFSLILFGLGLLMGIGLMQSLSKKETWIDFGYLHHRGKFLFYSWKKKIELGRVKDVVIEKSGHGADIDFYRVVVKHEVDLPRFATNQSMRNRKLCIADDITSKKEAKWLKEELLEAIVKDA